jgi:hemerythrin-like domain-containing protein
MACIDSLLEDHRLIGRMLTALDAFTQAANADTPTIRRDLPRFATFFKVFGDVHHATKEEDILFPVLVRRGVSWEAGALKQAREEHRRERYFMRTIEQLAAQEGDFDAETIRHAVAQLSDFVSSMRGHLEFEQQSVFPLVEQLSAAHQAELQAQLEGFDQSPPSSTDIPEMRKLAEELTSDYSPRG